MGVKGLEDLRYKPVRASALMGVKAVQSTSVFQFSDEWVSFACLCAWLEYGS